MNPIYKIIFSINENVHLQIETEVPLTESQCCHLVDIYLVINTEKRLLMHSPVEDFLISLINMLKKVLHSELINNHTSYIDLGYLHNEWCHDYDIEKHLDNELAWEEQFCLASTSLASVWFYNDDSNSIIFEITPVYPFKWLDPEDDEIYISYEEWKKNYKPYLITALSCDIAQKWLEQAENLLPTIEQNVKKRIQD